MTIQRRRTGQDIKAFGRVLQQDRRGNTQYVVDMNNPLWEGRAWIVADRSQRAEVSGQQEITVYTMGIRDLPEFNDGSLGLWSKIEWDGKLWDIIQPPMYRLGVKRHTRHWTISIRKRPETT